MRLVFIPNTKPDTKERRMTDELFPETASEKLEKVRVHLAATVSKHAAAVSNAEAKHETAVEMLAKFDEAMEAARDQEGKMLFAPRIDLTTGEVIE